jgi:hypothetical protein
VFSTGTKAFFEEVAFALTEEDVPRGGRSRPQRVLRLERPLNDFAERFGTGLCTMTSWDLRVFELNP